MILIQMHLKENRQQSGIVIPDADFNILGLISLVIRPVPFSGLHLVHASQGVKFLGVEIGPTWTRIQAAKIAAFKQKGKCIMRRNSPVNLEQVIADLNPVLRGFANYFRMANCQGLLSELMSWIRRRLRAKQLALWKKPGRLHRRLRHLGFQGEFLRIRMTCWRNSRSHLASWSLPNAWFRQLGLFELTAVETGVLPQTT